MELKSLDASASVAEGDFPASGLYLIRCGGLYIPVNDQSLGTMAVVSISTFALLSIRATTCTTAIAG